MSESDLVNKAGDDAIRAAFFLNGGAAISWLAYLSNNLNAQVEAATGPLFAFAIGVLAVAMSAGMKYFTLFSWVIERERQGNLFNSISIGMVLASYVLYFVGIFNIAKLFSS